LRRRKTIAVLCSCECHDLCPVSGRREVAEEEWFSGCTCPGGDLTRTIMTRVKEEDNLRKAMQAEVFQDID